MSTIADLVPCSSNPSPSVMFIKVNEKNIYGTITSC